MSDDQIRSLVDSLWEDKASMEQELDNEEGYVILDLRNESER